MHYNRANPSPRYVELLGQYSQLHENGQVSTGMRPDQTFPGLSLLPQAQKIKNLIQRTGTKRLLDYGAGKGLQYTSPEIELVEGDITHTSIQVYWGIEDIVCYDPAYEPFIELPTGKFDGVICTDVLEHCPEQDIPWILDELFQYASKFVYANIACYPAQKSLPNGENTHCTIKPTEWWMDTINDTVSRHPNVLCEFWLETRKEVGGKLVGGEQRISNF